MNSWLQGYFAGLAAVATVALVKRYWGQPSLSEVKNVFRVRFNKQEETAYLSSFGQDLARLLLLKLESRHIRGSTCNFIIAKRK